jgi:hypothetical protein
MQIDSFAVAEHTGYSLEWFYYLSAIIVAVLAVLFNEKLRKFILIIVSRLKVKNDLTNYFESKVPDMTEIDVFFFQFGLRSTLPIMDWFYLEYINYLNTKIQIKKLVIFPTIDKSKSSQTRHDLIQLSKNIRKIVKIEDIEIIDPHNDGYFNKEDLVSDEFITTLKYLGSNDHFEFLRRDFKLNINSIDDFNKYREKDDRIKDIYTHIYKSWGIVNYIKLHLDLTNPVNISAIFWEWEVDKIGVIKHFSNLEDNLTLYPVLGKTQMLTKDKPVPVYVEQDAICIFEDTKSIIEKAIKFQPYLKKYNSLLESVIIRSEKINKFEIRQNGKRTWDSFKLSNDTPKNRNFLGTKDFLLFLGLMLKIKTLIKNGN